MSCIKEMSPVQDTWSTSLHINLEGFGIQKAKFQITVLNIWAVFVDQSTFHGMFNKVFLIESRNFCLKVWVWFSHLTIQVASSAAFLSRSLLYILQDNESTLHVNYSKLNNKCHLCQTNSLGI